MSRKSGWHRGEARKRAGIASFVAEPAMWDELLAQLGMTDECALAAILEAGKPGETIEEFVRRWCRGRFVPEPVLGALDLDALIEADDVLSWNALRKPHKRLARA